MLCFKNYESLLLRLFLQCYKRARLICTSQNQSFVYSDKQGRGDWISFDEKVFLSSECKTHQFSSSNQIELQNSDHQVS